MKLNNLKIHNRLILGFSLIIFSTIAIGIFSLFQIADIGKTVDDLYMHPYTVNTATIRIQSNINGMHRSMKDVVLSENSEELEQAVALVNRMERYVIEDFSIIEERFLGESTLVQEAKEAFENWGLIRAKVIESRKNNQYKKAASITKQEGAEYIKMMNIKIQKMADFASDKAVEFMDKADKNVKFGWGFIFITSIFTSILSIIIALLITGSIRNPLNKIMNGIKKIEKGELDYNLDLYRKDEIGILADQFRDMIGNLKYKSEILEKISEGDLSSKVNLISENDILALSVNKIVDNFSSIVNQADSVAAGIFKDDVFMHSDKDQLGKSMSNMLGSLRDVVDVAGKVASGDFSVSLVPKSDDDELSEAVNRMTLYLRELTDSVKNQNWLKSGQAELGKLLQGNISIEEMARETIRFLTVYLEGNVGCIYLSNKNKFRITGSYAMTYRKDSKTEWHSGEGIVGQAALEKQLIVIDELPLDYMPVTSGTGNTQPSSLAVLPCVLNNTVKVIIEIGFFTEVNDIKCDFLKSISNTVAIAFTSAESKLKTEELLDKTRIQSEALKQQQTELIASNEELEIQAKKLQASEEELKTQQEELMATNEELEEKTTYLEEQKEMIAKSNIDLEDAGRVLEEKAAELEKSSKYKSEFLANMSHELRTPLNSLLILAQDLKDNRSENLTEHQIQSAEIIHRSGNELLKLINEILDLSKIEAGKMELHQEQFKLNDLLDSMVGSFKRLADEKSLHLMTHLDDELEGGIVSDRQRLEQIFRNLISNSVKFTEKGEVSFIISKPENNDFDELDIIKSEGSILFTVKDTGIGIPEEKQRHIFEAFHQVDGSISRKYGGTGLGLSIVRELTRLLGGKITLKSVINEGTEIKIILPADISSISSAADKKEYNKKAPVENYSKSADSDIRIISNNIKDDSDSIAENDRVVLVVEDDSSFAEILRENAHSKNMKFLHSGSGEYGIELAEKYLPHAVILDITLPGINGWTVLEQLKSNTKTRHIPVHMISADEETIDAYRKGAVNYLTKPVSREKLDSAFSSMEAFIEKSMHELLIIEDNDAMRSGIKQLIVDSDVNASEASTGNEALKLIENNNFDCLILDLGLPDMSGFELLNKIEESKKIIRIPPVIIYTGMEITREQEAELDKYASSIIVKGVKSRERLLDEASLFLHRVVSDMPEQKQKMINLLHNKNLQFEGKKILIVDDDMRNVFALGKVLEDNKMEIYKAANGLKALEVLEQNPEIDLVLMDIMMPVMDGFEAMEKIREQKKFKKLPIIAVTAKAMKEDQDKCFESGANDYIAKPVNIEKLLSLIRLWMY